MKESISGEDACVIGGEEVIMDQDEKKKKKRGPGRPKREVVPKVEKAGKELKEPKKIDGRTKAGKRLLQINNPDSPGPKKRSRKITKGVEAGVKSEKEVSSLMMTP